MHSYKLHLYELGLDPNCDTAGDILNATRHEPTVLERYRFYTQVFLEADLESLPSHSPQNLAIKLLDGKQLP
jgi:hypothetical protein